MPSEIKRQWQNLVAWAYEPERHGCHRLLDDYRPIVHSLERYAFCPEGFPYYPVMKAYFGHKDPFHE